MTRWAAGVEYRGTGYAGWQSQDHATGVQQEVERALSSIADEPVAITAAGRTDAGVHALGQVIHFDSTRMRPPHAWLFGANTRLPPDISLRWVQAAAPDFHARYGATARRYRYVIHNGRARSALLADRASWVIPPLDAAAMHRAAQALLGEHDFSAFRGADCQSPTPMRRVIAIRVRRARDFVVLDVEANAFLHHMVRNIVGVLVAVGEGRQAEAWPGAVLQGRDRTRGGMTVPACGLYFIGPEYPAQFGIPSPPEPWFPAIP